MRRSATRRRATSSGRPTRRRTSRRAARRASFARALFARNANPPRTTILSPSLRAGEITSAAARRHSAALASARRRSRLAGRDRGDPRSLGLGRLKRMDGLAPAARSRERPPSASATSRARRSVCRAPRGRRTDPRVGCGIARARDVTRRHADTPRPRATSFVTLHYITLHYITLHCRYAAPASYALQALLQEGYVAPRAVFLLLGGACPVRACAT